MQAGYNVKYISPLSLARLASGAVALQETASFVAGLSEVFPEAVAKFDARQAVDEFGRMKPVFHYYAAANNLVGGHRGTESIDDFENFRIGIVKTGGGKGVGVLYSVDGRIYEFTCDAAGIGGLLRVRS